MKISHFLISLSFVLILNLSLPTPVFAQDFSLSLSPSLIEIVAPPGGSVSQTYTIKNNTPAPLYLIVDILPFEPADEIGNLEWQTEGWTPKEIDRWFPLSSSHPPFLFLIPHATRELVLAIKIPAEAEEKDYYFSLVLTPPPTPPQAQKGLKVQGAIASNILITVSKDNKPRRLAETTEFTTRKLIDSFENPVFTVKIKNTGDAFLKPDGNISIYNTIGRISQKSSLLPENVLVQSTRQISCQNAKYAIPCQLEAKFWLGRYQTQLTYEIDGKSYQVKIVFWALPVKLGQTLLPLLILGLVLRWFLSRRRSLAQQVPSASGHPSDNRQV